MPTAYTWNASWSWNQPGLTWNGVVPNPTPPMPDDNRISAEITDAVKASILLKVGEIRALLPFLINLTPDERQELPKLGDKTVAFDEKCATYMTQFPTIVPGFISLPELAKDRDLRMPLDDIFRELTTLCEGVSDTRLLVGTEIFMADVAFYQSLRQAAKRGVPGTTTAYDDLKLRFPGGRRPNPPTP